MPSTISVTSARAVADAARPAENRLQVQLRAAQPRREWPPSARSDSARKVSGTAARPAISRQRDAQHFAAPPFARACAAPARSSPPPPRALRSRHSRWRAAAGSSYCPNHCSALRILNQRRGDELAAGGDPRQFLAKQFRKRRIRLGERAVGGRALPPAGQGLAQQLGCRQLGRHAHRIATTNNRGKGSSTAPSGDAG